MQSQTRITVFPRLSHFKEFNSTGDAATAPAEMQLPISQHCQERQKFWVLCINAKTFIHDPRGVNDLREGMEGFSSGKRRKAEEEDGYGSRKLIWLVLGGEPW